MFIGMAAAESGYTCQNTYTEIDGECGWDSWGHYEIMSWHWDSDPRTNQQCLDYCNNNEFDITCQSYDVSTDDKVCVLYNEKATKGYISTHPDSKTFKCYVRDCEYHEFLFKGPFKCNLPWIGCDITFPHSTDITSEAVYTLKQFECLRLQAYYFLMDFPAMLTELFACRTYDKEADAACKIQAYSNSQSSCEYVPTA